MVDCCVSATIRPVWTTSLSACPPRHHSGFGIMRRASRSNLLPDEEPNPLTSSQRRLHTAGTYFASGDFERSEAICRELWDAGVRTPGLSALLGEILLLRNRPAEADPLLDRAVIDQGGNPRLLALLAECRRRGGKLTAAASLYRQLGRGGLADKLTLLAHSGQYLFPEGAEIQVPWLPHSELPLVEARVNGTDGHFLLDTGVGETLIDPALARVAGLRALGVEAIHFPSGPAGRVDHTVIDALGLGDVSVERVPAHVHPTRDVFANLLPFQWTVSSASVFSAAYPPPWTASGGS